MISKILNSKYVEKLKLKAKQFNGEIVSIDKDCCFNNNELIIYPCPFDKRLAIDYFNQVIFLMGDDISFASIIHEMGHTFASKNNPFETKDESIFHGWEFLLAKEIVENDLKSMQNWYYENRNYSINWNYNGEKFFLFTYLSSSQREIYFEEMISCGREYGNIDADNKIICVR